MTIEEFILLDKAKVRRDSNLMSLYLEFFKQAFNKLPNCAGCSFGTDWQKLVSLYSRKGEKKVTLQKGKNMNTISIKKIQGKILTYKKDGKTYRQYDNILTDAFIKEYVSNGTEEEIKDRLKMFNFPNEVDEPEKETKSIFTDSALKSQEDFKKELKIDHKEKSVLDLLDTVSQKPLKKRGRKPKK